LLLPPACENCSILRFKSQMSKVMMGFLASYRYGLALLEFLIEALCEF
jgi:hypothetical protein